MDAKVEAMVAGITARRKRVTREEMVAWLEVYARTCGIEQAMDYALDWADEAMHFEMLRGIQDAVASVSAASRPGGAPAAGA